MSSSRQQREDMRQRATIPARAFSLAAHGAQQFYTNQKEPGAASLSAVRNGPLKHSHYAKHYGVSKRAVFYLQSLEVSLCREYVHMFGVTRQGHSACLIKEFGPTVFVQVPRAYESLFTGDVVKQFVDALSSRLNGDRDWKESPITSYSVGRYKRLVGWQARKNLYVKLMLRSGYAAGSARGNEFARARGRVPLNMWSLLAEKGGFKFSKKIPQVRYRIHNLSVSTKVQFLKHYGIRYHQWIAVSGLDYVPQEDRRPNRGSYDASAPHPETTTQLVCTVCKIGAIEDEKLQMKLGDPKAVCVGFDIETVAAAGSKHFPEARFANDVVTNIGTVVLLRGEENRKIYVMHALGSCTVPKKQHTSPPGHTVDNPLLFCFESERALLKHWHRTFFLLLDADELCGYNSIEYDLPYLVTRSVVLGLDCFRSLGKYAGHASRLVKLKPGEMKAGSSSIPVKYKVQAMGRSQLDVLKMVMKVRSFTSYKLKNVAKQMLPSEEEEEVGVGAGSSSTSSSLEPTRKIEDVEYSELHGIFVENGPDKWRVARYCLFDTAVCVNIMLKNYLGIAAKEESRFAYTEQNDVVDGGQQSKLWNVITSFCMKDWDTGEAIVINKDDLDEINLRLDAQMKGKKFQGATVIANIGGFHGYIGTLDFSALYPSIMIGHNLCYSSAVLEADLCDARAAHSSRLPGTRRFVYETELPDGTVTYFMQPDGAQDGYANQGDWGCGNYDFGEGKAVIPRLLIRLLEMRRKTRAEGKRNKKEGNLFVAEVLNLRQLAIKVICNSVYGFTGAKTEKNAKFPFRWIAQTVTTTGRGYLERVRWVMESPDILTRRQHYESEEEYPEEQMRHLLTDGPSFVIYGDTDSVMVHFNFSKFPQSVIDAGRAQEERGEPNYAKMDHLIAVCERASAVASRWFPKPNELEYEKFAWWFVSYGKKKYASLITEDKGSGKRKFLFAGLEIKRSDWSPFTKRLCKRALEILLEDGSLEKVRAFVVGELHSLASGGVALDDLAISVGIKNQEKDFARPNPSRHVRVAKRWLARDPSQELPRRFHIVKIQAPGREDTDSYEELEYVRSGMAEGTVKLDLEHFMRKDVIPPLKRLLGPVLDDKEISRMYGWCHSYLKSMLVGSGCNVFGDKIVLRRPAFAKQLPNVQSLAYGVEQYQRIVKKMKADDQRKKYLKQYEKDRKRKRLDATTRQEPTTEERRTKKPLLQSTRGMITGFFLTKKN